MSDIPDCPRDVIEPRSQGQRSGLTLYLMHAQRLGHQLEERVSHEA